MIYAIYDLETGEIKSLQEKDILAEGEGALRMGAIPHAYIGHYYVVDRVFTLRPASSVIIQEGVVSFVNPHPDAIATIANTDGGKQVFEPQDVRLTTPGRYYVALEQPFPYSDVFEDIQHD